MYSNIFNKNKPFINIEIVLKIRYLLFIFKTIQIFSIFYDYIFNLMSGLI